MNHDEYEAAMTRASKEYNAATALALERYKTATRAIQAEWNRRQEAPR